MQTSASTPTSKTQPNNTSEAQATKKLSSGAKAGIGTGTVVGVILAVLGVSVLLYIRKRSSSAATEPNSNKRNASDGSTVEELSSNPLHELSQLETKQSAVELPSGYSFH
jgi:uncharacterized protein HemX